MSVQYYSAKLEKLIHPQKAKIRKFLEHGCISKVNDDEYICYPIIGYNSTTYTMKRRESGDFKCNCQGFNKRGDCSHVQALNLVVADRGQGDMFAGV